MFTEQNLNDGIIHRTLFYWSRSDFVSIFQVEIIIIAAFN